MYDILKYRISAGGFKLDDIQSRVKRLYASGDLTATQMDELLELSQQKADPEAERPEIMEVLRSVVDRVTTLEKKLNSSDTGSEEDQPKYEEWVQPVSGLTDKYQYGAITSCDGKLWRSIFKGQNVWKPGTIGTELIWVEYIEEV